MFGNLNINKRNFIKAHALLLGAAALGFVPDKSFAEDKPPKLGTLKLGWVKSTANLMAYIAPMLSAKHGLRIESINFNTAQDILTALIAGQLDVGLLTPVHLLRAIDTKLGLLQIAGNTRGNTGIVAKTSLGLRENDWGKLKDLLKTRKLKVGSSRGSINELLALATFKKHGIDARKDIDLVNIANFALQPQALRSGEVDLIVTLEPLVAMVVADGTGTLFSYPYDTEVGDINTDYVTSSTLIAKHPAKLAAFVATLVDAERYLADPKAEMAVAVKLTGLKPDVLRAALKNCHYDLHNDVAKIEALAKISWDLHFTSRDLSNDVTSAVDDQFLRAAGVKK